MDWGKKEILLTGGTGSLGKALTNLLLEKYHPKGIRIFSRDELKQFEMRNALNTLYPGAPVSFLIGDVRDGERLKLACKGVDILIHAAALKQVPACENNPLEAIHTNVIGAQNIVYAAIANKIEKVMAISTDKACYPINLYGATKMCAEKLFINANAYSGGRAPYFSCVRYGNVIGSRGSVIPLFKKQYAETGKITITDKRMSRFWITLDQVASFVVQAIEDMKGGELFIPKIPSATVMGIAKAICPDAEIVTIGIRAGEKLHETLITKEESEHARFDNAKERFEINLMEKSLIAYHNGYCSDTNTDWLTVEKIKEIAE